MIKSMTGFGRYEIADGGRKYTAEIKGVNHRYLDVNIRMPKKLNCFETQIRHTLKQSIIRGKVDVYLSCEDLSGGQMSLKYNEALAQEYLNCFRQMKDTFGLENDIQVSHLSRYPEVFTMEEADVDVDVLWRGMEQTLLGAAEQFSASRSAEGEQLKADLLAKLDHMAALVADVEEREPQIMAEYRQKLQTRVAELAADTQIEESRLAAEVVIFADKICTDEEVVRLKSHVQHMKETLLSEENGVGRKLDFIAQEMNREANTILSKANDLRTSDIGIELKTEIEKIREQVQNIE